MSGIPSGIIAATKQWAELRDQRMQAQEKAWDSGHELDYDTVRGFEERQDDAATDLADLVCDWLRDLGEL